MTVSTQAICSTTQQQRENHAPQCKLQWRQGQLLVSYSQDPKQPYLPPLDDEQWLVRCLQHSPVRLVRIDPTLGEAVLKQWANACEQANKPLFFWGSVTQKPCTKPSLPGWYLKRLMSWIATLLLLLVLSPVMLAIVLLMYIYSPGEMFSHSWHVGVRGKLFQAIKFRTTAVTDKSSRTTLGHWMCKYRLDELPQLFNVLQGEMSLVGLRPLSLSEAVRLSLEE